jgi:hypothetical protein
MNAEEVQAVPDVVYGEFIVNSTSATVLFDFGASYSFVSNCFILKNGLQAMLLPTPLMIRTPEAVLNIEDTRIGYHLRNGLVKETSW